MTYLPQHTPTTEKAPRIETQREPFRQQAPVQPASSAAEHETPSKQRRNEGERHRGRDTAF
jgi:hypothetical protein